MMARYRGIGCVELMHSMQQGLLSIGPEKGFPSDLRLGSQNSAGQQVTGK